MNLLSFIFRRLLQAVFVLFGLSIVIFGIARVMPGDPVRLAVGARAPQWVVDNIREQMHLNDPLITQYGYWLRDALQGDFGISLVTRRAVAEDIVEFFPASLEIALLSLLFSVTGAITLGMISTRYKDRWVDNVVRVISYMGIVTPSFVFAILFLLLFAFWLDWLPAIGRLSSSVDPPPTVTRLYLIDSLLAGQFATFWDALQHMIMPALALAMGSMAQEARITRSSMSDNLSKDYIASARSLGISEGQIMSKFLMKPSLIPTVSILGLDFAAGIGNAFLVELIYNWPGISRYGMNAMLSKDLNAISGVILTLGIIFVLVNIVVDVVVAQLDPRIRLRGRG